MTQVIDVIALLFAAGLTLFVLYRLPAWWTGRWTGSLGAATPYWWMWGDALYRGLRRAYLPAAAASSVLVLGFATALVTEDAVDDNMLVAVVVVGFGLLFLLAAALMLVVVLLNRPKGLVPPRHRSEPGAISEWRSARGRRRPDADL